MNGSNSSATHDKVKEELPDISLKCLEPEAEAWNENVVLEHPHMVPRAAHHGNNPLADTPLKTEEKVEALEFDGHLTESMNHSSTPIEQKPLEKEEVPEITGAAELVNDATSEQRIDRPKKKTRWVLDCVMLWTWADLQRQKKKQEEKDLQMMNAIKNPKIKKAVRDMGLQPSTIRSRLEGVGLELFDIQLEKPLVDTLVPRIFLSNTYGGSPQEVHPRIAERFLNLYGYNDWMYLVTDYHPDAPQVPGAPGIYLEFFEAGEWRLGQRMRVFTRVQTSPNLWQYMGMYEVKLGMSLTKEEWAEQTSLVRMTWASRIANSDWGSRVSARVRARRDLGREPTPREVENTLNSYRVGEMVNAQQVEAAYLAGEETMGLYTMKCVGYDYTFQKRLCQKFQNWVAPPPRPKKKNKPIERE